MYTSLFPEDAKDGKCLQCNKPVEKCKCDDIVCVHCEDRLPRKHKCVGESNLCPYCDGPFGECECIPQMD